MTELKKGDYVLATKWSDGEKSRFTIDDIRAKVDLKLDKWRKKGLFLPLHSVEDFIDELITDLTEDN